MYFKKLRISIRYIIIETTTTRTTIKKNTTFMTMPIVLLLHIPTGWYNPSSTNSWINIFLTNNNDKKSLPSYYLQIRHLFIDWSNKNKNSPFTIFGSDQILKKKKIDSSYIIIIYVYITLLFVLFGMPVEYNGGEYQMIRDDNVLLEYNGVTTRLDDVMPIRDYEYVLIELENESTQQGADTPGVTTRSWCCISIIGIKRFGTVVNGRWLRLDPDGWQVMVYLYNHPTRRWWYSSI